jgi:hypothetical protein
MTNNYINALATAFDLNEEVAHELVKEKLTANNLTSFLDMITTQDSINGKVATEVTEGLTTQYKVYGEVKQRLLRVSTFVQRFNQGTYLIVIGNDTSTVIDGTVVGLTTSGKALVKRAYKVG